MKKKIVLAGGSGHLGQVLTHSFLQQGYHVVILTRQEKNSALPDLEYVQWDGVRPGEWVEQVEGAYAVINLSGETIRKRFTKKNKVVLEKSRILPTKALGEGISMLKTPPPLWINFSGISIFGGVDGVSSEVDTRYGNDFLAELTKKWENQFMKAETPFTKKIILRISPVLSKSSGMFAELYPLVKIGLGGKVGNGQQYISWIHEWDLINLVNWLLTSPIKSTLYHACSPNPVTNTKFMKTLREAVGITVGLPLPTFFAKLGAYFKGVDDSLLLQTTSATTLHLIEEGFEFQYPLLHQAFNQLIKSKK